MFWPWSLARLPCPLLICNCFLWFKKHVFTYHTCLVYKMMHAGSSLEDKKHVRTSEKRVKSSLPDFSKGVREQCSGTVSKTVQSFLHTPTHSGGQPDTHTHSSAREDHTPHPSNAGKHGHDSHHGKARVSLDRTTRSDQLHEEVSAALACPCVLSTQASSAWSACFSVENENGNTPDVQLLRSRLPSLSRPAPSLPCEHRLAYTPACNLASVRCGTLCEGRG